VRGAVKEGARLVIIDSLNGYMQAMPDERFLTAQLHELLSYLGQQGVLTLLLVAQHGLIGSDLGAPADVSYLADAVIVVRYFEAKGAVRKAISVLKKRTGGPETTIREYEIRANGIHIGEPLRDLHAVLSGTPEFAPGSGPQGPA
jgi:circadian clock protein KaiC